MNEGPAGKFGEVYVYHREKTLVFLLQRMKNILITNPRRKLWKILLTPAVKSRVIETLILHLHLFTYEKPKDIQCIYEKIFHGINCKIMISNTWCVRRYEYNSAHGLLNCMRRIQRFLKYEDYHDFEWASITHEKNKKYDKIMQMGQNDHI